MALLHLLGDEGIYRRQVKHLAAILQWECNHVASLDALPEDTEAVFVCYQDALQRVNTIHAHPHLPYVNLIHPSAQISPTAELGNNLFIDTLAIVAMAAKLGDGIVLNSRATVEHDNVLHDGVFLGTGVTLCGHVTIDACVFLGGGATVKPGTHIHTGITVGTGAVVVSNLTQPGAYVGNPARLLDR